MQILRPWLARRFKPDTIFWMDVDYLINHISNQKAYFFRNYIKKAIKNGEKNSDELGRARTIIDKILGYDPWEPVHRLRYLRKPIPISKIDPIKICIREKKELFDISDGRHRIIAYKFLGIKKIKVKMSYSYRNPLFMADIYNDYPYYQKTRTHFLSRLNPFFNKQKRFVMEEERKLEHERMRKKEILEERELERRIRRKEKHLFH
jgi:hypothetical protein